MPGSKRRLLILSEIIAPYRIPVFNALARCREIDLHVVFLAETDATLRQWPVYKDEIRFSHEVLPSWRLRLGGKNVLLNWRLGISLKRFAPETIICGGYNYPASWQALLWARRNHAEFVLWSESNQHDARSGSGLVEWMKSYFLERCDRYVAAGASSFAYLQLLGLPEEKILTAPSVVDNDWFEAHCSAAREREDEIRRRLRLPNRFVLFAGRLVEEKGVFDLLQAYGRLEHNTQCKVSLVFAGEGSSRAELEQRAKRIAPGTVCFLGFAQREELAAIYGLADVLVLPTHSDPWGLVVNEAMACGLPVIVSSIAGCAADLVEEGWNGFVVPPADPDELCRAIDHVLRDDELRQQMGRRSLERIRKYSPEACAAGLSAAAFPGRGSVE